MRTAISFIAVSITVFFATVPNARADQIVIGQTSHGGKTSQWICRDGVYTDIGTSAGTALDDDYAVHGSSGSDGIEVIRSNRSITGDCAGSWSALQYGTHYLDVYGDGGNDNVFGGAGNTFSFGGAGNDFVVNYSSIGKAQGDDGSDIVLGLDGSGDVLYGNAGSDCLEDYSGSWLIYNCGPDTDYRANGSSGTSYCENPIACCFC